MTHLFPPYPLPQQLLCDGARVSLWSQFRGMLVRIQDDGTVCAKFDGGDNFEFIVHEREGTWSFESTRDDQKWLRIYDGAVDGKGNGGLYCKFNLHPHADGTLSLESHEAPGQHIGFLQNGDTRPATETGRGDKSRIVVALLSMGKNQLPLPHPGRLLIHGSVVNLLSRASGKAVRRKALGDCNEVDGRGGGADWAQFIVHVRGPGVVALQTKTDPNKWLRIYDNCVDTAGNGGMYCNLLVQGNDNNNFMSLESLANRGQHVGILPNGDAKETDKTGRGVHGQLLAIMKEPGPLSEDLLAEGATVALWSVSRGFYLRIEDSGIVSAKHDGGDNYEFTVHRREGAVAFQSKKDDSKWMRMYDDSVNGEGDGGLYCNFRAHSYGDGVVFFESNVCPGQYIGIQRNGEQTKPSATIQSLSSMFYVILLSKGDHQEPSPRLSASRFLKAGSVVSLLSLASGKTIRRTNVNGDNVEVDGRGGGGDWARFIVRIKEGMVMGFECLTDSGKWLQIKDNCLTVGGNRSDLEPCYFHVRENDNCSISLESALAGQEGQHVGVVPNGDAKEPGSTGRRLHGQFSVIPQGRGREGVRTAEVPIDFVSQHALSNKSVVHLWSRSNGSYLWVNEDGDLFSNGDTSKKSEFKVELKDNGTVVLANEKYEDRHLRIEGNCTNAKGRGGDMCEFKVIRRKTDGFVSFESNLCPGQHIGVLPNGHIKPPENTKTGIHGQFFVALDESKKYQLPCCPPSALLEDGSRVHLLSRSAGRAIKCLVGQSEITCVDSDSSNATVFIVHKKAVGVVALQSAADGSKWLRLNEPDDKMDLKGHGGNWGHFYVYANDELGTAVFESCRWRGKHVGILPNGDPKPPSNTGRGKHGQFYVIPVA